LSEILELHVYSTLFQLSLLNW